MNILTYIFWSVWHLERKKCTQNKYKICRKLSLEKNLDYYGAK